MKRFTAIVLSSAFLFLAILFLINSPKAFAGYEKCGQDSFMAHGAWQNVTITAEPNIWSDPRGVSCTGYAVHYADNDVGLEVCEGNTWNATAVFIVLPPGIPRICNIHNPLVHQEGLNLRVAGPTSNSVTVETWIKLY